MNPATASDPPAVPATLSVPMASLRRSAQGQPAARQGTDRQIRIKQNWPQTPIQRAFQAIYLIAKDNASSRFSCMCRAASGNRLFCHVGSLLHGRFSLLA